MPPNLMAQQILHLTLEVRTQPIQHIQFDALRGLVVQPRQRATVDARVAGYVGDLELTVAQERGQPAFDQYDLLKNISFLYRLL